MKRSLVLSLCAVILATIGLATAQADVDVALNIRYTDPADPNEGGTWTLVAKTDDPNSTGLTALVTRFQNIPAAGTVDASIGHDVLSGLLGVAAFGSDIEFTYGQDPNGSTPGIVANVGLTGGPSDQGGDPLRNSAVWDNASVIATGSLATGSGNRPTTVSAAGNETVSGTIVSATIDLFNVRGDSLNTLGLEDPNNAGLRFGDANRDFVVAGADLLAMLPNLNQAGVFGWDDGDFNDDDAVAGADLLGLLPNLNTGGGVGIPPAIGAIPEPSAAVLLSLGVLGLASRRRKSSFKKR